MRKILASAVLMAATVLLLNGVQGGEKAGKQVTLTGTVTCAKCDLGKAKACETVIVTKVDGKETVVHFDAASHKKHHGAVCTEAKEGTVTGTLSKQGEKAVIAVTKVDLK